MALSKKKKDEIPDSKAQKTTLCRREFLRPPSGGDSQRLPCTVETARL